MILKIKDKNLLGRNCILDNFITRKFEVDTWDLFEDKGSGYGIFPDPSDPKRQDPTGSGSATLEGGTVVWK